MERLDHFGRGRQPSLRQQRRSRTGPAIHPQNFRGVIFGVCSSRARPKLGEDLQRVQAINLLERFIWKKEPVYSPWKTGLRLDVFEILIIGFEHAEHVLVDFRRRRGSYVAAEQNPVLILQQKAASRVRLASQMLAA